MVEELALTAGLDVGYYGFSDSVYMPNAPQEGQETQPSLTDTNQTSVSARTSFCRALLSSWNSGR